MMKEEQNIDLTLLPYEIAEKLPNIGGEFGKLAAMCKSHVAAFIEKEIMPRISRATAAPVVDKPHKRRKWVYSEDVMEALANAFDSMKGQTLPVSEVGYAVYKALLAVPEFTAAAATAAPVEQSDKLIPTCPDCQQGYICEHCGKPLTNPADEGAR